MINLVSKIATELKLREHQVHNAVQLLVDEECTIPFVARYRKEMTGSLDEVALRDIRDRHAYLTELEDNKVKYLKVVEEHCKKKPELMKQFPDLKKKFENAETKQELEDLYLPFKPKRRTRAQIAREKGLAPLLDKILAEARSISNLDDVAREFVTPEGADIDPALKVPDTKQALAGAADILAETIAETAEHRALVRDISMATGMLVSKRIETAEAPEPQAKGNKKSDASKYENYFDYRESINTAVSHRIMAVRRGEAEKVLKVTIEVDGEQILARLKEAVIVDPQTTDAVKLWTESVVEDSYRRLLAPSIETEIRLKLKNEAETEAIRVFSQNLENLLLLPPIPGKTVLGVDPGLRTGSKLAVVSEVGKVLAYETIYPDPSNADSPKSNQAKAHLLRLITQHNVECIAIGNGTGSREIDRIVTMVIKDNNLQGIKRLVVNEAGASVYSTDDIAREEFPDLDPTIRSAISIARRLQDPLAELVKIDPRSIGVGQYQHDVNVTKLKSSLEEVVESCVNRVGVNVNTASYRLLSYVSGIGPSLAKNIVTLRDQKGRFLSREDIRKVSGFGPKAFEQAAGFLRVPESANPLDNSAVHPERYAIVEQIASDQAKDLKAIVGNKTLVEAIPFEKYVTETIGMPTLQDIAAELIKPGRDPREDGARLMFSEDVCELEDLKPGMVLPGTVTNVTNFGAFVDIGVHQDGLVHISELSTQFVDDPSKVISVGEVVQVRVLDVDLKRRRISLSRRLEGASAAGGRSDAKGAAAAKPGALSQETKRGPIRPRQGSGRSSAPGKSAASQGGKNQFTLDDLMAKFNGRR